MTRGDPVFPMPERAGSTVRDGVGPMTGTGIWTVRRQAMTWARPVTVTLGRVATVARKPARWLLPPPGGTTLSRSAKPGCWTVAVLATTAACRAIPGSRTAPRRHRGQRSHLPARRHEAPVPAVRQSGAVSRPGERVRGMNAALEVGVAGVGEMAPARQPARPRQMVLAVILAAVGLVAGVLTYKSLASGPVSFGGEV